MPCSDGGLGRDLERAEYSKKIKNLEAALCAMISSFRPEDQDSSVHLAARKGNCPYLIEFWKEHKEFDEQRLNDELDVYSEQELDMIASLISERKRGSQGIFG